MAGHGAQGPRPKARGPGPGGPGPGPGPGAEGRSGRPSPHRVRSCMPCIKCRCRGVCRWRGARAWGTKGATRCIFSITVMGVVPSRCFANQPNLHLTLFGELRTLHLTLFVELRCPASHRFRRWCAPTGTTSNFIHNCMLSATIAHSHIVSAALEITPIADVACVHNHTQVGDSCSALIDSSRTSHTASLTFIQKGGRGAYLYVT